MSEHKKLTKISIFHYFRLVFRSVLLIVGIVCYIICRLHPENNFLQGTFLFDWFIRAIWVIFAVEMLMRFFPSRFESPGCQKQFERNYIKTGNTQAQFDDNNAVMLIALLWVTLNGIIGMLKLSGILNDGIMVLICLLYSVCDMICILFFCPFQSWFLKNKCCSACRIYNWDYAMMFTPLFFIKSWYSWTLLAFSIGLLFRWEITIFNHPERFSEKTNAYLKCSNCCEKLCWHKKQLSSLWVELSKFAKNRIENLK